MLFILPFLWLSILIFMLFILPLLWLSILQCYRLCFKDLSILQCYRLCFKDWLSILQCYRLCFKDYFKSLLIFFVFSLQHLQVLHLDSFLQSRVWILLTIQHSQWQIIIALFTHIYPPQCPLLLAIWRGNTHHFKTKEPQQMREKIQLLLSHNQQPNLPMGLHSETARFWGIPQLLQQLKKWNVLIQR